MLQPQQPPGIGKVSPGCQGSGCQERRLSLGPERRIETTRQISGYSVKRRKPPGGIRPDRILRIAYPLGILYKKLLRQLDSSLYFLTDGRGKFSTALLKTC